MRLKYKNGQKLRCVIAHVNYNFLREGKIITIYHSKRFNGRYEFNPEDEEGWDNDYIENLSNFVPVKDKVDDWKEIVTR